MASLSATFAEQFTVCNGGVRAWPGGGVAAMSYNIYIMIQLQAMPMPKPERSSGCACVCVCVCAAEFDIFDVAAIATRNATGNCVAQRKISRKGK